MNTKACKVLSLVLALVAIGAFVALPFCTSAATSPVWAWGQNYFGQLGYPSNPYMTEPTPVMGLTDIIYISGGENHSAALKEDGTVWTWGGNNEGQLGDGTKKNRATPLQVDGLSDIVDISCGSYYSLALKDDGTI